MHMHWFRDSQVASAVRRLGRHRRRLVASAFIALTVTAGCDRTDQATSPLTTDDPAPARVSSSSTRKGFMLETLSDASVIANNIVHLSNLGANIVRFPIYLSYQPSIDVWLAKLDAAVAVTGPRNMVLVIDLHHTGPSQRCDIADPAAFVSTWSRIAQHFTGNASHIWYDLCNEPQNANWSTYALQAARAIRRVDPRHRILYAVRDSTTRPLQGITPLAGITNQSITVHFYDWNQVQGANMAPYPNAQNTKADLAQLLHGVASRGRALGVPIYIGEVAIHANHPNAPRFLRDFTGIADQEGLDLTVHAFREAPVWNYESNPAAWQVLAAWLAR
jgi:hypothetical protein